MSDPARASVLTGLQSLSPKLRKIIKRLSKEIPAEARGIFKAIRSGVPEYATIRDPALVNEILEMCAISPRIWYQALLSGRPPKADNLKPVEARARRRVHQGISLSALLHAYRAGFAVTWNVMLKEAGKDKDVREEVLFKVSPYLLYHVDLLGQAISQAYSQELQQHSRWRDRLRHELCGILYSNPEDTAGFRERAMALGLDASAPHVAFALRMGELNTAIVEHQTELDTVLLRAASELGVDSESMLRTLRPGHLLLWLPVRQGEAVAGFEQRLVQHMTAIIESACGVDVVGIGLPGSGATGWRRSGDQALHAIEIGWRLQPAKRVFCYSEVALEHAVMESPPLAHLFQNLLERLGAEPMLLKTLRAFCDHGPHRKAVASALGIHPNTLVYRLERIESLLGGRLDDLRWMSQLHLALRLRQLSLPARTDAAMAPDSARS